MAAFTLNEAQLSAVDEILPHVRSLKEEWADPLKALTPLMKTHAATAVPFVDTMCSELGIPIKRIHLSRLETIMAAIIQSTATPTAIIEHVKTLVAPPAQPFADEFEAMAGTMEQLREVWQGEPDSNGTNEEGRNENEDVNAAPVRSGPVPKNKNAKKPPAKTGGKHASITQFCSHCATQLRQDAQFCNQCGTNIATGVVPQRPAPEKSAEQTQLCPHCTKSLPLYQPYCNYCASPTVPTVQKVQGTSPCACPLVTQATLPRAPFCGKCGHLARMPVDVDHNARRPVDVDHNADTDSGEDTNYQVCKTCHHNVNPALPFCGFCGSLSTSPSSRLIRAGTGTTTAAPLKPTYVYDPARRICVDVHNPNIPGSEPPAYTPNPMLINWKLPARLDAADKARLQAIQAGLGLLYEAVGKEERCAYPANGIQQPTPWGQLTSVQRAMATLERELAFAAYTISPMQLKPGEAKRRLGTANIPFTAEEQHATRREVQELRRDERAFGGRAQRQPRNTRASSSSEDAGGQGGTGGGGRGYSNRGGHRRQRRTDQRERSRDRFRRDRSSGDRRSRQRNQDQGNDTDSSRKVAGDAARTAMLSRIADLEKASSRRKPGAKSGDKSGEE